MALDPPADPLETCDGSEMIRVRKGNRWRWLPVAALVDYALTRQSLRDAAQDAAFAAEMAGRGASDTAQAARLATLEARPEEVVPFSGSLVTGVLAVGTKPYTLTVPGIRANERLVVEPVAALPAGLSIAGARAPATETVEMTLSTLVAITASKTIALTITALR